MNEFDSQNESEQEQTEFEAHLKVFKNRSELAMKENVSSTFKEGRTSKEAKARYKRIQEAFQDGFLEKRIVLCRDNIATVSSDKLSEKHIEILENLVASVTSEVGRALVGLTVMQVSIKAIEPEQNIRLHKSSNSSSTFSWVEGLSMRSLDKKYVTRTLREYDLLKLNADGFMMTRSLAENYPYSFVYKAQIRGAREEWIDIVEGIESGEIDPPQALDFLVAQLLNRAEAFKQLAKETVNSLNTFIDSNVISRDSVSKLLKQHMEIPRGYAARLMEIMMHSLMQAVQEAGVLGAGEMKPLSQMRSANKKHGNIGDVEVLEDGEIIEAWDAKYGKGYLRDEIEELNDKLRQHIDVGLAGFVTTEVLNRTDELEARLAEVAELHDVDLYLLTLDEWIERQFERAISSGLVTEEVLAQQWITAYTESLAQMRRKVAPIDEPCHHWLESLRAKLSL